MDHSTAAHEPAAAVVPDGRPPAPPASDEELVTRLRARDDTAYAALVRRYSPLMLRLVHPYVPSHAIAEEVVQDVWLSVVAGIDGFEGRAAFRTWLLRILVNTARTRGRLEHRTVPWSSTPGETAAWERHLAPTPDLPSREVLQGETLALMREALRALPERQRTVLVLRDVEGRSSREVCARVGVSTTNQRVLLHRARARIRTALAAAR